jgi:hypothetical protein
MRLFRVRWVLAVIMGIVVCPSVAWGDLTAPPLDPENFPAAPQINNPWFPLIPGTQYVYRGQSDRDGTGLRPARVVFIVTDATKVVDGVRSRVIWDRDYFDGAFVENEAHLFASDFDGNVWSLGEHPEELENGEFAAATTTWLSGIEEAQGGIHVPANPQVGAPPYVQGIAPAVGFFNAAQVTAMGLRTCVPFSCFRNVLLTNEFSPDEPGNGGAQKYYAQGIGNIRVEPAGSPEMESLKLTSFGPLGKSARAKANAEVLKLDEHAYEVVPDVWGESPPAVLDARRRG